jgi:hypothetical protein
MPGNSRGDPGHVACCYLEPQPSLARKETAPVNKALFSPWTISVVVFAALMVAAVFLH